MRKLFFVFFAAFMLSIVSCCNKQKTETNPANTNINENADAGKSVAEKHWANPWMRAKVGDKAVYLTEQGEVIWELIAAMPYPKVKQTIPGDEALGEEPSIKEIAIDFEAQDLWWKTIEPANVNYFDYALASGEKLKAAKIRLGNKVFIISEQAPFDSVLELRVDNKLIRKLKSFKKAEPKKKDD